MSEVRAPMAGMNGDAGLSGVSIIVPTRDRVSKPRCLEHVSAIRSDAPWELIVVDNGSSDETQYAGIFRDPTIGFAGGRILPYVRMENERDGRTLAPMESEVEIRDPAGQLVPCGIVQGGNMALRPASPDGGRRLRRADGAGHAFSGRGLGDRDPGRCRGLGRRLFPGPCRLARSSPHLGRSKEPPSLLSSGWAQCM